MSHSDRPLLLVVDDEAAIRRALARILGTTFEVLLAEGAADALRKYVGAPRPVEIVVTDYSMPGSDGLMLAQSLRRFGFVGPLHVLTGNADAPALTDALAAGLIDSVMQKPWSLRTLLQTVTRPCAGSTGLAQQITPVPPGRPALTVQR